MLATTFLLQATDTTSGETFPIPTPPPRIDYSNFIGEPAGAARARWNKLTQGENLALGKEVAFSRKPNYSLTVSDSDPYDLTTGKLSSRPDDRIWFASDAVGWTAADHGVSLTIDLGEKQPVDRVAIRLLGGREQSGLVFPSEIALFGSEDGEQFFLISERRKVHFTEKELVDNDPDAFFFIPEDGVATVQPFVFQVRRTLRYVALTLKGPTGYVFTDQVAIIKADESVPCPGLADLKPVQFIRSGISIRPKHEELVISTNVPTPNFFRVSDNRPEPDRETVRFIFDLPQGVSVAMGPYGKAFPNSEAATGKNEWIIDGLYKGVGTHRNFGPFYFEIGEGVKLPDDAVASFSVDRQDSAANTIVTPVRSIEIPEVPPIKDFDVSLAWMEEVDQYDYPEYFSAFRHLGFNTVAIFPRNQIRPDRWERMVSFVKDARKENFRILYNESPFHIMWNNARDVPELRNQIDGKPGRLPCPSYTGEYYQKEIARVAKSAKATRPDIVFFDIELWRGPTVEAKNCSRCQEAFAEWKKENQGEWTDFLISLGDRMGRDLHSAITDSGPDGTTPDSGIYAVHTMRPVIHNVHHLYSLHPELIQFAMPSLYVQGDARRVHEVIRDNTEKLGSRQTIPWLTSGTNGEIPPHKVEQMVLESFLNGARGIAYFKFWDFEPMDFYYHARALKSLAPYQGLLKNGKLLGVSGSNSDLVYSAFGSENEALVLVGNYQASQKAETALAFNGRQVSEARDIQNDSDVAIDKLEIDPDGHRLLLVKFKGES